MEMEEEAIRAWRELFQLVKAGLAGEAVAAKDHDDSNGAPDDE